MAGDLFDNWFDPLEAEVRANDGHRAAAALRVNSKLQLPVAF
jgi:hypothetical protein